MTGWDVLVIVTGALWILVLAGGFADHLERRQARQRDDWRYRR